MVLHVKEMRRLFLYAASIATCLMVGCGGHGLRVVDLSELPIRSASPEELVAVVNRDAASLQGLKAKLEMALMNNPGEEARRCSGMLIAVSQPHPGLYLKGYKRLIPTFFTLVSDGDEFWFHIPRDDVVYTGPADFAWSRDDSLELYLNARDLFRALFVRPVATDATWDLRDEDAFYVITINESGGTARTLWIERKGFNVVRETYYDGDRIAQLEIQRGKFVDLDGRLYPSSLVLNDLISGSSVFLDFSGITLDPQDVPEEAFQFRIPDDVDVRPVETNKVQT